MRLSDSFPPNQFNETLVRWTAPPDWVNPTATGVYNMVIIGGGSAGLVIASGAAQFGAKVALIEKNGLGGDCLNVGCVPSKALIRAAKTVGMIRKGEKLGVSAENVSVDFEKVMTHVWEARSLIAPHDSAERYTKLGVDVYFGEAKFVDTHAVEVDGQRLQFKKCTIATGSRPAKIPIPGLAETGYLTNETLWNLTEQPKSLAMIGAGPIGVELAQSFQRLGTQVTLIDIAAQVLAREDAEAAEIVQSVLVDEGVELVLGAQIEEVSAENGQKKLTLTNADGTKSVVVDEIMLAAGRTPNLDSLNLDVAGVAYNRRGLEVTDSLVTTNPDIYGAGDVASKHQFTHAAGHSAAIVIQNALFADAVPFAPKRKLSDLIIPWVTYSDPELAHVGLSEAEAAEKNIAIDTWQSDFSSNDRNIADSSRLGFVKIHTKKGSAKILGATIVGAEAGEMINEISLAMKYDIGLGKITSLIHPYPTKSETVFKAAAEYSKTKLTPMTRRITGQFMKFTRR